MTTTLQPPPAPPKPRDPFNGRRGPRITKENARAFGLLGQAALKAQRARKDALAAAALAAGNANLELLFRGSLNATLQVLLSRYRSEVNRSPLRPKFARELLELTGHNAKLLGISLTRPGPDPVPTPAPPIPVSPQPAPVSTTSPPPEPGPQPPTIESGPID